MTELVVTIAIIAGAQYANDHADFMLANPLR